MSRIVLTTVGSFGDLHPKIALALELRRRGHDAVFATHREYRHKIERLGFAFHAMRPDASALGDPLEMARLMHPYRGQERVIRHWLLPRLEETFEDLLQCAGSADLIISGEGVFAARLVAEKLGIPWVCTVLQPLSFLSVHEPLVMPGLSLPAWLGHSELARRMQLALIKAVTSRWAAPVTRLRARIGLPPLTGNLLVDDKYSPRLVLALFSKVFAKPQADWPPGTLVTGFPFYDASDAASALQPGLSEFLNAGPPPVVFTLGSSAVMTPGSFFEQSVSAARQIGRRAILLVGRNSPPRNLGADCLALDYVPFSALFPHASAIVHQGGVGTTGQALRAGRPTLVMPYSLDQPDNAARAQRLGTSLTLSRRRYQAPTVARALAKLLERPNYARQADEVGRQIRAENGPQVACDAIETLLSA
jgi:UDP:flavonoid glycosyltransferase YjiC (YdhE family)